MSVANVGDIVNAGSPFRMLAEAWLEDLMLDVDRANGTKVVYEYELRGLELPFFEHFTVREVTVGRIELFLKVQRAISYTRVRHSRTILSMVLGFAVRRGIIPRNPVKETSRMKKPQHTPKALTPDQIAAIRLAARDWRMATRIGEALALRKCYLDMAADPPWVHIRGTLVVQRGAGVLRQAHPKTHESNRSVAVPQFAAEVIRRRLTLIEAEEGEHLLFFARNGKPLAPHNVRRTFREILRNAGLEGRGITPHAFRRTGATLLANELGMQAAADVLGHTSTSTTKAHYAEPGRAVKPEPATVLQRLAPPA